MILSLHNVMSELYESEINVCISSFWDGGWNVRLGDAMNGYHAEKNFDNEVGWPLEAATFLIVEAAKNYPDSDFVRKTAPKHGWLP